MLKVANSHFSGNLPRAALTMSGRVARLPHDCPTDAQTLASSSSGSVVFITNTKRGAMVPSGLANLLSGFPAFWVIDWMVTSTGCRGSSGYTMGSTYISSDMVLLGA